MSPAKRLACAPWVLLFVSTAFSAEAAETFRKLSGKQISAKLTGMEFSDEVHWREIYERGGSVRSYEMGRTREGKWRVAKDRLCVDLERTGNDNCYQLWMAGDRVEMRTEADQKNPIAGILRKPTDPVKRPKI